MYKHIREMSRWARKNKEKAKIVVENISKVKFTHRFFFNSTVLSIQHAKPNVTYNCFVRLSLLRKTVSL